MSSVFHFVDPKLTHPNFAFKQFLSKTSLRARGIRDSGCPGDKGSAFFVPIVCHPK